MTEPPVVKQAALERLKKWGGESLLRELIGIYRETAPGRLAELRRGVEQGQLDIAERAAHTMKSSAGNLGAVRVAELTADVERRIAAGELDGVADLVRELEEQLGHVLRELKEIEKGLAE
jgi:HPt (histidine-containing phosphotransfer) domain-containing protein